MSKASAMGKVAVLSATVLSLATACGSTSTPSGGGSKAPIQLGAIWAITGPASAVVSTVYHDMQFIVDDLNTKGGINGRQIDVTYLDDQSDPATATLDAKQLIEQDGIKVIVGDIYTPAALAEAAVAEAAHVVLYSPESSAPALSTPLQHYIFASYPRFTDDASTVVTMMKSMGITHPGLIMDNTAYGTNVLNSLQPALSGTGIQIAAKETLASAAIDATTQVAAMKAAGVDAIIGGVGTAGAETVMMKDMYNQGVTIPLINFSIFGGINKVMQEYPIEQFAETPLACTLTEPCAASFVAQFSKDFPADTVAVQTPVGYAVMTAFFTALARAADPNNVNDVIQALQTAPAYNTPFLPGPVQWTSTNHLGEHYVTFEGFKAGQIFFFGDNINDNKLSS